MQLYLPECNYISDKITAMTSIKNIKIIDKCNLVVLSEDQTHT